MAGTGGRRATPSSSGTSDPRARVGGQRRDQGVAQVLPHFLARVSVPREGLLRRLHDLPDEVTLVLLCAPPGYGKTTLARQFAERSGPEFAWLQVGASVEVGALAQELALAVTRIGPLDDMLSHVALPWADLPPDVAARQLANAARAVRRPVTIVIDDVHRLRTRAALDLVTTLAERLPAGSRVVATADRRPRLQLARLRATGRVVEFGARDLALDRDEAGALLRDTGLDLPASVVTELLARSEGWPAGLHLAATTVARSADPRAAAIAFGGRSQELVEYVQEEMLGGLSVESVRFLMQTSSLDRMSASLCDAALGTTGAAAWLVELADLGMPIVPLDDQGEWFRYERLFAEVLRELLRRREPGENLRVLRRAAQWYEAHGRTDEAIDYAVAGRATLTAARLIAANAQRLNSAGGLRQIRRWVEELDPEALEIYPPLAATVAWIFLLTGDAPRARHALHCAESGTFREPMPDGSASLESAVARARAGLAPDGVDAVLVDAQRAVALEPPGSAWHTLAALLLGSAFRLVGNDDEAARWFEQAVRFGREEQRPGMLYALGQDALRAEDAGDWATAAARLAEIDELVEAGAPLQFPAALVAALAAARRSLHEGNRHAARYQLARALEVYADPSPVACPWLAAQTAVYLGRLLLAFGDVAGARLKLIEARRHVGVMPDAGCLPAWVDALAQEIEQSQRRVQALDETELTKAELRVLQLLPTHRSLAQIGDDLVVSRNTVKSQVAAIYRKLGVATRDDAVSRAHELGLLEPGGEVIREG